MQNDNERLKLGTIYENIIDAALYVAADEKLTISNEDGSFFAMLGYRKEEYEQILENSLLNSIFAPDRRKFIEAINGVNEGIAEINLRLMNKQAGVVWYNAKILCSGNKQGKTPVYFCVFNDITLQKNTESEYEKQTRFMQLMESSIEGGTLICFDDKRMSIAYISKSLVNFLGYSMEEFEHVSQGSLLNIIYDQDRDIARDTMESWFKSDNYFEIEYRIKKKDGSLVWVMNKGNRIKNENGDNVLVSIITDINSTQLIIEKLEEANKDLRSMQNSIPGCFGKLALMEDGFEIISINQQLMDMFMEYQNDVDKTKHMRYDALSINQGLINEIAIRQEKSIELEIENLGKWFMLRGTFEDELYNNKFPVYYMMFTDITSQKENQVQAELQKEKYQKITEITDDIIFEYDCIADVMVYSERYRQILDRPTIVFNFKDKFQFEKNDEGYVDFEEAFDVIFSGQNYFRKEYDVMMDDGNDIWLELTAKGIINDNGDIVKIIGILRDIDKQKKEQIMLYDKSRIDLLSGLYNKISTQEEIVKAINALNPGAYAALMMIDIDDFKSINDTFGHIVGDEVIQKISNYLQTEFKNDIIGRVGGDEFQVFMYNVLDEKMIEEKAQNICAGVRNLFENDKVDVTVSVGVYYTNKSKNYKNIYQKADVALYNAKSKGKNRFEIYGKLTNCSNSEVNIETCSVEKDDLISAQVISNIIKTLSVGGYNDGSAINKALSMIAEEIEVDRIIINEIDRQTDTYSLVYEWYRNDLFPLAPIMQELGMSDYVIFNENEHETNAYYYDDEWHSKQQNFYFKKSGFKGIVQVPISINDKVFAYIEYISIKESRVFSKAEMKAITSVSNALSGFLCANLYNKRIIASISKLIDVQETECEYIIKVNLEDDSYEKYIFEDNDLNLIECGEDYFSRKLISEAAFVLNNENEKFVNYFSKDNLVQLCSDNKPVYMDYECETVGKHRYIRRVAFNLTEKYDVEQFILIASFNMTKKIIKQRQNDEKMLEIFKEKISAEFIFDEILEINLKESTMKLVYSKDDSILRYLPYDEKISNTINYLIDEFVYEEDKESLREMLALENVIKYFECSSEPIAVYIRRKDRKGEYKWINLYIIDISKEVNQDSLLVLFRTDEDYISQMNLNSRLVSINQQLESSEESIRNQAKFDSLTGIYKIEEFYRCCKELFLNENEYKLAMVRMDIDKFKLINDLYGYEIGDEILKHTASVIKDNIINHGLYGRMNSDIFCMCVRYKNTDEIIAMIEKIVEGLSSYDAKYRLSSYYGICLIEDRTIDVGVTCDWANIALKKIKGSTLTRYAFYDNNMRMNLLDERKFESQMEYALSSGQFEAYLQPQYDIRTSTINGAEALIRWNHPIEGVISPGRFIPLFERNGFVTKVDEFIWRESCKILRKWIDDGYKPVPISVNVSRLHMFDENLCDKIIALLNEFSLPRHLLVLEVTETVMYDDSEAMNRMLNKMRNMGFQIAMDDFGSGYSSLNMLENMCLDELKIDREFLTRASNTENGKVIVKFIIALAKQLNLKIIAEGVENVEQAAMLLEFGCYNAQGYFYSRPVPIDKFESQAFDVNEKKQVPKEIQRILETIDQE